MTQHILTTKDLHEAIDAIKENSKSMRRAKEARALQDFNELKPFWHKLGHSTIDDEQRMQFSMVIMGLAEGNVLVIGEPLYTPLIEHLRKFAVPEKVIANILLSENVPAVSI